jgi:uncharacterized membrane protein
MSADRPGAHGRHRLRFLAAAVAVVAGTLLLTAGPAAAVDVSTDYPVVNVQAGQNVTLTLNLAAASIERVALSVAQAPAGWTADLQGGGFTVGGAYVGPNQTPTVTLHVQVPRTASTGRYHVIVDAEAPSGATKLDVQMNVLAQASDAFTLTSQFDKLQGSTTDSFDFSLSLANNTGTKATFGLTAAGPQGWTVTASPASQNKAAAVDVDSGSSADVSVTAKPPADVAAGTYPITVTATGQGTTLTAKLSVEVTGSGSVSLATADQVLNANGAAGNTTDVHLVVSNTGTAPLSAVSLASTPPTGWTVTFDPKTIDTIEPGKSADVVARVQPAGDAITGDYQVTLSANGQSSNDSVDIRYTVETSTWWGLVGVIVIAVAVVALLWLFRRYGRR